MRGTLPSHQYLPTLMTRTTETNQHDHDKDLPRYATALGLRHQAFADTLRRMVADLSMPPRPRILDVACGDGTYSALLAQNAPPGSDVVGLDDSKPYLEVAQATVENAGTADDTSLVQGDAFALPFQDEHFDVTWCAHNLITLKPPSKVLAEMVRVTRPGGKLAVVETDDLHSLVLSWPGDVELSIHDAVRRALRARDSSLDERCFARRGRPALVQVGLESVRKKVYVTNLDMPLEGVEKDWLRAYLGMTWKLVHRHLSSEETDHIAPYLDPERNHDFLRDEYLDALWLDYVFLGRRPGGNPA